MPPIEWATIVAECDSFRDGFVAVFRKYEGQPTDERTAQNHIVKVTAKTFAEHMNIPVQTFRDWLKSENTGVVFSGTRSPSRLSNDVKRAANIEPQSVVEGIANASPDKQREIMRELIADPRVMPSVIAGSKIARTKPPKKSSPGFLSGVKQTLYGGFPDELDEMTKDIAEGLANGLIPPTLLQDIEDAATRLLAAVRPTAKLKVVKP